MLRMLARAVTPAPLRRWLQHRKLQRQVAAFQGRTVTHRYGDVSLKVELADPLAEGWYDHDWQPLPEFEVLACRRLKPGARVFDIGAHQGVVGLMLAHFVGSSGQVVLVEASAHNVRACRRNIELNGMPWVIVEPSAISDRAGMLPFNTGLNGQAAELSDYAGVIEVPALTIDDLTNRHGIPDVVFLDVEGYECRALAGAARTLGGPTDWVVELHVGCGLELAGGSVERVIAHFPSDRYDRFFHADGDAHTVPLESVTADKLSRRFFLTALRNAR